MFGFLKTGKLLSICILLLALAEAGNSLAASAAEGDIPSSVPGYTLDMLRRLAGEVERTGVGRDSIPAVYRPSFVNVSDASLSMENDEPVFVVQYPGGVTRVYPQRILVWHEVVNDVLPDPTGRTVASRRIPGLAEAAGDSYTVAYSPLTGCVTAFRSMAGRFPSTFGVSGELLNANTVLYDRTTNSRWSQLLAACMDGPLRGKRLERLPVLWAVWSGVKLRYPKAEVLSRSTGYSKNYGKDPYGSYLEPGSYYNDVRILNAISRLDSRLPPKKRILGVEIDSLYGAFEFDLARKNVVLNQTLGLTPLVAFYDRELQSVRVFDRRLPGTTKPLKFLWFENKYVDEENRSEWNFDGECTYGPLRGKKLTPVLALNAMWFAWAAFHPDTLILNESGNFYRNAPATPGD